MTERLYRSRDNAVIGGVAAGIGKYLDLDPVLIRIAWAILFFVGGSGLLLYILAWIIVPEEPEGGRLPKIVSNPVGGEVSEDDWSPKSTEPKPEFVERRRRLIGGGLVVLGAMFFLREIVPRWVHTELIWALALIGIGVMILSRRNEGGR